MTWITRQSVGDVFSQPSIETYAIRTVNGMRSYGTERPVGGLPGSF
jgi:hypothetical protein